MIPGKGNFNVAKETIWNEVNSVLNKSPDGVVIITGDFLPLHPRWHSALIQASCDMPYT